MTAFKDNAAIFHRTLRRHAQMAKDREQLLYSRSVDHAETSIRFGSPVTGAPGQPVRSGKLRDSYHQIGDKKTQSIVILSLLPYANVIENNFRRATLRSKVGGWHSVKITRLNFRLIIEYELAITKALVKF